MMMMMMVMELVDTVVIISVRVTSIGFLLTQEDETQTTTEISRFHSDKKEKNRKKLKTETCSQRK
jgi:hypothetical protein